MSTELTKSEKLAIDLTMGLRVFDCSLGKEGEIITSNSKECEKKFYDKSLFDHPDYLRIKQRFISNIQGCPYNWKVELEEGLEVVKYYLFRYSSNSCSWEFNEIRQKHWMDGFSEKEREKIKKCLNSYQENSQKLKKEILNNLSSWSMFYWIFNDKEKIYLHNAIKKGGSVFGYKDGWSGKELSREDYQEVRKAIIKGIINQVKQNPHEWRIQDVCTFNGDRPDFKYMGGYQEWEKKLIHHLIPSQYGEEWKSNFEKQKRKVFWKKKFSNEEWAEIENALNHNEQSIKNTEIKEENKFQDLSWEELTKEIKIQKAKIEELKTNQNISISERQIELKKREEKLAKLEKARSNSTQKPKSGNNFPIGWVISGVFLLVIGGLTTLLIVKGKKRKK